MMIRKALMLALVTFASSTIWAQSPIDGTWNFSMDSPMGSISATVTMKSEGATLTGEFDMGGGRKWPIEAGTIEGNNISFEIDRDGASMTYVMNASVDGNSIIGTASAMGSVVDWSMSK
ncbi:MAG: hypothetical protein QGF90_17260 [Gammaproteobacteria bacterium]|jgi:fructose-1,6-bisphosphatase/inositol monophosphatase family enzyme|nr:hypothetical protein [Gammaproteobacteria bacterium]